MSRSPGARVALVALLSVASAAAGEQAREFATAEDAVAARAWEEAARIWRSEAEAGRPEAYLGLGNLWDLGVLGERDEEIAQHYYRQAAEAGLPEAAFNMGAMHAAGAGTAPDMARAVRWYALAALDGHDRAAFALGRLQASGDGLPRNPRIAAGWFEQAARSIPAAADALAALAPVETGALTAPEPLAFRIREEDGDRWATAAWSAAPGPAEADFRVEIRARGGNDAPGPLLGAAETRNGAIRLPLPAGTDHVVWRVAMMDPAADDYAASQWHDDASRPTRRQSAGTVSFWLAAGSARATAAARYVAEPLRGAGLRVLHRTVPDAPATSAVRYRYATDAPLARDIARFLPALRASDATRDPTLDLQPGEIVVVLAFD